MTLRCFGIPLMKRNNFQLADGLVYVCDPMSNIVGETYRLDQPSCVIPSAVPRQMMRFDFFKYLGGLVYEGRIDVGETLPAQWNFFQYSDYQAVADQCNDVGIPFFIYTTRKDAKVSRRI